MAFSYPPNGNKPDYVLDELDDIAILNPLNGQLIKYDGVEEQWENSTYNLDDVADVTITSVGRDQSLVYNGSAWVNQDSRGFAPAIYPTSTSSTYYFPQSHPYDGSIGSNSYQYINGLQAIKFGQTATINKWAIAYNNNSTIAAGNTGLRVRGAIYLAGSTGRPHTLVKDLGGTTIVASDDTGGQTDDVVEITLGSSVNLTAGLLYYVGFVAQPVNIAGHTNAAGPDLLVDTQANYQPWLNFGIPAAAFTNNSFSFRNGAYFLSGMATSQFSGNVLTDALPNNVENNVGVTPFSGRVGLSVSALA